MAGKFYFNHLAVLDILGAKGDIHSISQLEQCLFLCIYLFQVILLTLHVVHFFFLFPDFGNSSIQFLRKQIILGNCFCQLLLHLVKLMVLCVY